jgi:hypothetical protein
MARNSYDINGIRNTSYWATIPKTYQIPFRCALYRLELLKLAVDGVGDNTDDSACYLAHISGVMGAFLLHALGAQVNGLMNSEWRSPTMDRWLVIEWHIQRHTDYEIKAFLEENGNSALDDDPFNLGACFDPFKLNILP